MPALVTKVRKLLVVFVFFEVWSGSLLIIYIVLIVNTQQVSKQIFALIVGSV
jgi:phage shock protein PspC (stress-responsive transcriptional regulator)